MTGWSSLGRSGPRRHRRRLLGVLARRAILDAAALLIGRTGLARLTMDRVAREAGLAKGTLYLYFEAKRDLVQALKEHSLSPLVADLSKILAGSAPPEQRIREFVHRHLTYFDQHRDFFLVLLHDRDIAQNHWKRSRTTLYRRTVERGAKVLEEGMQAGKFRRCDAQKVAAMLLEANIAMIHQRLCQTDTGPVAPDAELIAEIFLHGLIARKGR